VRPYTSRAFVVDNKIVSTINFLRLLSDLEDIEEEHFNKYIAEHPETERSQYSFRDYADKGFRITDTIKASIQAAIIKIVDQAFRIKDKHQIAQLKEHFLFHSDTYFKAVEMMTHEDN
jgi:hypothetical protein